MKLTDRIRNFFFAATHSSALITENDKLHSNIKDLEYRLGSLQTVHQQQTYKAEQWETAWRNALLKFTPAHLSASDAKKLYESFISLDPTSGQLQLESIQTTGKFGALLGNVPGGSKEIERITYTNTLVQLGILPYNAAVLSISEEMKQAVCSSLSADKLPANMPVGRINYLSPNGQVGETQIYHNAADFVCEIMNCNYYGAPVSITVFSDPTSGAHIDTAWWLSLNTLPQGFSITPYPASPEQAAYRIGDSYLLHIQTCDAGYDYTLYNEHMRPIDGGQLDSANLSILDARDEILSLQQMQPVKLEQLSAEEWEQLSNIPAETYVPEM